MYIIFIICYVSFIPQRGRVLFLLDLRRYVYVRRYYLLRLWNVSHGLRDGRGEPYLRLWKLRLPLGFLRLRHLSY